MDFLNRLNNKFQILKNNNFIKFCIVGSCGVFTNLIVYYFARHFINIGVNLSAILAFSVAVTQNYYFNHLWSFEAIVKNNPNISDYAKYVLVNILGLGVNLLLLNIILKTFPLFNEIVAQALSILVALIVNYAGSYVFVFAKDSHVSLRIKEIFSSNQVVFFRKYIFIILTILGILFLFFQALIFHINPSAGVIDTSPTKVIAGDYRSYYFAGKHLSAGDSIYFSNKQNIKFADESIDAFVYPPLMAVFFILPSLLPFNTSYIIFTIFSIITFLLSVYLISKMLPYSKSFFWLSFIVFFSSPILTLYLDRGQTDIIILFLIVLSFLFILQKKSILSGVLIGLAALLKVTPLIFLPYFFIKDRKAFWSFITTILVISPFFGFSMWKDFFKRIYNFSGFVSSGNLSNSLSGVIDGINKSVHFPSNITTFIYLFTIILFMGTTLLLIFKNRNSTKLFLFEYGILSVFMIIIPGVSWAYNGVYAIFILAAYWNIRFNKILSDKIYFIFDILVYLFISQPVMSPLIRNFAIYHIFSLRPIILLCFVGLFIYLLFKKNKKNIIELPSLLKNTN